MAELARKNCVPCRGGAPPLKGEELSALAKQLPDWEVIDEHHLTKSYKFPDFVSGLSLVNAIGRLAEEQGHHPDLELSWGRVGVKIFTHKINGLSESDFILAAKIDELLPAPDPRD